MLWVRGEKAPRLAQLLQRPRPAMIEITEVQLSIRDDAILKAFVTLTLNDSFSVRGLILRQGMYGLIVSMPYRRYPDGRPDVLAEPLDEATRLYITRVVIEAYERKLLEEAAAKA
jgi:DNA-binding cell septation regulator SpoVG